MISSAPNQPTDKNYCMVTGDFNICSHGTWEQHLAKEDQLYTALTNSMARCGLVTDLFLNVDRTFRQNITEMDVDSCYDHAFVNDLLKNNIVSAKIVDKQNEDKSLFVSDHYGLAITFKVE